jgi:hypothetical protein
MPGGFIPPPPPTQAAKFEQEKALEIELQTAMEKKDIATLERLLNERGTENQTKAVRRAFGFLQRHKEDQETCDGLRAAIEAVDVTNLKALLIKATNLGIDEPDLIREARHLAYGLGMAEQLTLRIKQAMLRKDLPLLKQLLEQADKDKIDNEETDSARTFLNVSTSSTFSSSRQKAKQTSGVESQQSQAYHKFLDLRSQCPLSKCHLLRAEGNYSKQKYFQKKNLKLKRLQWQREDVPRSLIKLSTAYCGNDRKLSKHIKTIAKQVFKNIRGYMGDHYHPYPVTLAYEVVNVGVNESLLRDEIFCQLIKQTTLNPSEESVTLGLKLFYLCISTFAPSKDLTPFVFSHLALFAHASLPKGSLGFNKAADLATNCWVAHQLLIKTVKPGEAGDPPSMRDIEQMTVGTLAPTTDFLDVGNVGLPGPPSGLPGPPMGLPGPPMGLPGPPMGLPGPPSGLPGPPAGAPPAGLPAPPPHPPTP